MTDSEPATTIYHFAVYEVATGKVLRIGQGANPRILEVQKLADGEALYAGEIDPATQFLPGGFPAEKPEEVVSVTPAQVKAWAARILTYTDWVDIRSINGPAPSEEMSAYRQAVRDRSGEIEAMTPIPADYRDPKYWPVAP